MKLHLPFALLIAVVSAASYAEAVTHTLNTDTSWTNNSTVVNNQSATIEAESGTTPNFEISGYSEHAFYSQSDYSGSTSWTFRNLGDVSVVSNSISITNSLLSSSNPDTYQGLFRAMNMNGQGFNTLQIKNSGNLSFSNNCFSFACATGNGAPIIAFCQYQGGSNEYEVVSIDANNKAVLFDSNTITGSREGNVKLCGGSILIGIPYEGMAAMLNNHPKVTISNSSTLTFSNNAVSAESLSGTASASGGALYGGGYSIFDLSDNKAVAISDNSVTAKAKGKATAAGGGSYGNELRINNVQDVTISGNKVDSYSENNAAESSGSGCMMETIAITNNGSLEVKDNVTTADGATSSTANGSGLSSAFTTLTGNEEINIVNNGAIAKQRDDSTAAKAVGGGIYSACITLADNKNTNFRGNYVTIGAETKLSAITLTTFSGLDGYLDVSAPKDGSVVFYDPINVTDDNAEPVVNFNKATDGVDGSGEGTIIFSGEHTEKDLAAIIGRAPTPEELEASRTNSVACETKLHGGTMRVESQAVFSAEKFSVQDNSNATVEVKDAALKANTITFGKNSTLKAEGKSTIAADSITFASGSSMTVSGIGNTIKANTITFAKGSSFTLNVDVSADMTKSRVFTVNSDNAVMDGTITLNLNFRQNLRAGRYMLLMDNNEIWEPDKVTAIGADSDVGDMVWKDGILYFCLSENLVVVHDPLADAVQAANWGVYKSSQAFTSLLWAPRPNAVVLKNPAEIEGSTLAWGSVYTSFSRISSSGNFSGAEYNIYGGAIGAEHRFVSGRSLGVAFGYDRGEASPFTTSRVSQESWHAALYGRAAERKLGKKSSIAVDWSATVGSTTSEQKNLGSDWTQENIQLDARATYSYALTQRTALSAFAGTQYYAQTDVNTNRVEADSMQNLRLLVGAGISHKLTEKTTIFGEATLYNDTMRHNPDASVDGFHYGTGANPGRLGGSITAGAQYQLTPDWTLHGNYSYEGAGNSNEHRVNVGAAWSF